MRLFLLLISALALTACTGGPKRSEASMTAASLIGIEALEASQATQQDYRIGTTDTLSISVFRVPDMSFSEIRVDASGNIQMPLIGSIQAAGLTTTELTSVLTERLGERYLRNPQITVTVVQAASQKITIDGAVTQPGVYQMQGRTTLLQAVAMARGPTNTADLTSVAVFRVVEGRRMVAVFDLAAIRNGNAEDPVVLGDDVIVVDTSRLSEGLQSALRVLPSLAVFRFL